jgi:ABC-type phosphate/phosphonate transport system permease subunit
MPILLFLVSLVVAPAVLTWALVRLALWRNANASRAQVLKASVPLGAIVPLLPWSALVALSDEIYNPLLIAVMGTALAGVATGLCVALPTGLALTRHLGR